MSHRVHQGEKEHVWKQGPGLGTVRCHRSSVGGYLQHGSQVSCGAEAGQWQVWRRMQGI